MILVEFYKNGFLVKGHSNYSQKGSDIVCAAVSGIVLGSLEWFDKETIIDFKSIEEPPLIKLIIKDTNENLLGLSLILNQLKSIENKYGKYLSIKNIDGNLK